MQIKKFKLSDGGRGGVEIEANEYLKSGKMKIQDNVKRTRKIPLSNDILDFFVSMSPIARELPQNVG